VISADGEMQGVASAQAQRVLVREPCRCAELQAGFNRMVKLSTLSRVNIASASARWMASICPLRSFMERAAENSVLLAGPSLHAAGLRLIRPLWWP
jgi:hypothetical protein